MDLDGRAIEAQQKPLCAFCGSKGEVLYQGLRDRLWGAPGFWGFRRCTDPGCGLLWLDPCPLETDIGKAYLDYFTHEGGPSKDSSGSISDIGKKLFRPVRGLGRSLQRLAGAGIWAQAYRKLHYGAEQHPKSRFASLGAGLFHLFPGRRAELDFQHMHLRPLAGARLLEVGCGSGEMLQRLRGFGWDVLGQDVDPGAVAHGRKRGLEVRQGSLESLDLPAASFDAIVMSHVLEHLYDPIGLLNECHRLLKPGGALSLVVPNAASLGLSLFKESWLHLDPPRHIHLFSAVSLNQVLKRTPFQVERIFTSVRDAPTVFHASMDIRRKGFHTWGRPRIFFRHIWTTGLLLIEALLPGRGEELVAVLRKA